MLLSLISGLVSAFSMYSILPMPKIDWGEDTLKYTMCFFPAVGLVCGLIVYGWIRLCLYLGLGSMLAGAGIVLIPFIISGGIHMDGLIDSSDALGSNLGKDERLRILKDPHVGAFGVMGSALYLVTSYGLAGELYLHPQNALILCVGYVVSRAMSGIYYLYFPMAKNTGLAYIFSDNAQKNALRVTSIIVLALCALAVLLIDALAGFIFITLSAIWAFIFRGVCIRCFGGFTGDLAGFSLSILELIALAVATLSTLKP